MTKKDLYYKFEKSLEGKSLDSLLHYMFDFFSYDELKNFHKHIEDENGDNDDELLTDDFED